MLSRVAICLSLFSLICGGCATSTQLNSGSAVEGRSFTQRIRDAKSAVTDSWTETSTTKQEKAKAESESWDWVAAIPEDVVRAELLTPEIPNDRLTSLLPDESHPEIKLVSYEDMPTTSRISKIAGQPVGDYDQLQAYVDSIAGSDRDTEVELIGLHGTDQSTTAVVSPKTLMAMTHYSACTTPRMRVNDGGTSRILIRDEATGCKVNARVERQNGLLQLDLSVQVHHSNQTPLPVEVLAFADGQPLSCLSVADTLELLHGDPKRLMHLSRPERYSFATVSESNDYLIPSNFKRLQPPVESVPSLGGPRTQPALTSVPGKPYPGPAVLGDARALTAFSLQRQLCQPGTPGASGWIMFAGDELRSAKMVELDIDLGSGPQRVQLQLPAL